MAEQEKWTKGPWRVRFNEDDSPDVCSIDICGDIFILARMRGPQYSHCAANAHLIGAAPSMADYIKRRAEAGDAEASALLSRARGETP
jgi:hypothetical protein